MRSKDIISEQPGTIPNQTISKGPNKGNYKYNPTTRKYDNTDTGQSLNGTSPAYDKLVSNDNKAKRKQDKKTVTSKRVDPRDDRSKYNQQGKQSRDRNDKRVDQQIKQNFGDEPGTTDGKSNRVQQYKKDKAAKARDAKSQVGGDVSDFAKQRVKVGKIQSDANGLFYQYTDKGWLEVTGVKADANGMPTKGSVPTAAPGKFPLAPDDALSKNLTSRAQGKDQRGVVQKAKDYASDKINTAIGGELASKTSNDPDATTGQKLGAKFGAGIGRAMTKAFRKGDPADKKAIVPMAKQDLTVFQKRIMDPLQQPEQKLKLAQDMVAKLVKMHAGNTDVNNYLNTVGPILKQSGLNKSNPAEYQAMVTQARALRTEAYQHMNKILEAVGLTWEDIGYKVIISESITDSVVLMPIQDIQLSKLKTLAGL